ncbi:energy transducer TonB [Sphingomonas sp.]|uniref:energy transducer TonB family protein n=1 Tax=Sphingomonas sp. TaxID=28214 RepID=UPI00325FBEF8
MYTGDLTTRDRAAPVLAVIAVHAALGFMLLGMSGHLTPSAGEQALKIFDVREVPPPPEIPPPTPKPDKRTAPAAAKPKAAAPPAKKATATPIVLPPPKLVIPVPTPIAVAPKPGQGTAASQGAATAGTGSGASGVGNGTGGGGNGNGTGGSGDGGTHPRPLFRPLNPRSFPQALVEPLPPGARVLIIFTVQLNGSISDCSVRQPSGSPALDALVCQVATQRFRYDPARRGNGTAYVAKAAYMQVF